ncbi:MAG: cytochrome b/b6 domain-containing protein [Clostridia bacterium]
MKRKIILDIVMGIIMICLMNLSFTGIKLHEILGIVVFFLFIFHKILNLKWIKSITINLFKKGIKTKTKIMYVIDIILLILVILNVITGILISTHILTNITTNNIGAASQWHHFFAYWLAIVLLIHIGVHWEFIRNAIKIKKDSLTEKIMLGVIAVIVIVMLLKCNIVKKLMIPRKEIDLHYEIENTEKPINNTLQKENESDEDKNTQTNSSTVTDKPTIEEYLSKLFCTGCGRHCPLTNPACGKGMSRQTQEIQEYNQMYNTNETYTSNQNRKH